MSSTPLSSTADVGGRTGRRRLPPVVRAGIEALGVGVATVLLVVLVLLVQDLAGARLPDGDVGEFVTGTPTFLVGLVGLYGVPTGLVVAAAAWVLLAPVIALAPQAREHTALLAAATGLLVALILGVVVAEDPSDAPFAGLVSVLGGGLTT